MGFRSWIALGTVFEAILVPKIPPWNLKNRALPAAGAVFFTFRGFAFRVAFGPQLEAILGQLGLQTGAKMASKWGSKWPPKSDRFGAPFWTRFGPLLGSNLGAKTAPDAPRNAKNGCKMGSQVRFRLGTRFGPHFGSILGWFLEGFRVDFGLDLGGVGGRFWGWFLNGFGVALGRSRGRFFTDFGDVAPILRAVCRATLARRAPALRAQYGGRAACSSALAVWKVPATSANC